MTIVHDIDRPDIGNDPKMVDVAIAARAVLRGLVPVLSVKTDDNLCSSVWVSGSLDPREDWANGIYENGRYFRFFITPMGGKRYYGAEDPKVTVELQAASHKVGKFRKGTTTVAKALDRIRKWLTATKA